LNFIVTCFDLIDHFQTKETATVSQIVAKRIPLSCFDLRKTQLNRKQGAIVFERCSMYPVPASMEAPFMKIVKLPRTDRYPEFSRNIIQRNNV